MKTMVEAIVISAMCKGDSCLPSLYSEVSIQFNGDRLNNKKISQAFAWYEVRGKFSSEDQTMSF